MARTIRLQFDPNQEHQLNATNAIVNLFDGLSKRMTSEALSAEIVANLPQYQGFATDWLAQNLLHVQQLNRIPSEKLYSEMWFDSGMMLKEVSNDSHENPHFTIEMETGTGKTYVYLRTMYELFMKYGFLKYVIVVPSIAIYEGVRKTFDITRTHFAQLYQGHFIAPTLYDGEQLSRLRDFATSTLPTCLIMTLDSFNKKTNKLFKASEKLPGERLPFHYIQETRPIIILDEPQNMESEKAQQAIRTLKSLFVLRYSATHKSSPNLTYRLTPFEAFRRGLVKRIEVDAVTERDNINDQFFDLREITPDLKAIINTRVSIQGQTSRQNIVLKGHDNLFQKTGRDEHQGYIVNDINARDGFIEFTNGEKFYLNDDFGINLTKASIFRVQIRATIERHMERQSLLDKHGVKVLSLFFIDRVANYTASDGLIKRIFDEEFERIKRRYPTFAQWQPEEVREAYFAKKRDKKSGLEEAVDTDSRNDDERKAEKEAFELIMRDKERLLRLDEPVAFIFAHSALKEGWDNPNVFQICTLNQTQSEIKKRQEIGRGLRLCVNQAGERLFDEDINILTVIANESYRDYVDGLQSEYQKDGVTDAPPEPTKAKRATAHRNDTYFNSLDFAKFWQQLSQRTKYHVNIDTAKLIDRCVERLNNANYPKPMIVLEHGQFVMTRVSVTLLEIGQITIKLAIETRNTRGEGHDVVCFLKRNDLKGDKTQVEDIGKKAGIEFLRGYKLMQIYPSAIQPYVELENGVKLYKDIPFEFTQESTAENPQRAEEIPVNRYPIFDLIGRAARETDLTRPTLNNIFSCLSTETKKKLLQNPEGFANVFISTVRDELTRHIVDNISFEVVKDRNNHDLEELFPPFRSYPQRELMEGGQNSLYDRVQKDSDVEVSFVLNRLKDNERVVFYFKFPPAFKVELPRIIGNYNPDWGVVYEDTDKKLRLHLIRETKGTDKLEKLQFASEGRKIQAAAKHFEAIGIDYRHVSPETQAWWDRVLEKTERLEGLD